MKILLFLTIIVLTLAVVTAETCPDGRACDGECCKKFLFGNTYYCCKGILKCQQSIGIGYCLPIQIPIPIAERKPSLPKVKHLWTKIFVNAKDGVKDKSGLIGKEYLATPAPLLSMNKNMDIDMKEEHDSEEYMLSNET